MDDRTQRFSDLGQRDQRDEESKTWEERDREIKQLLGLRTVLNTLSQRGQLDLARRYTTQFLGALTRNRNCGCFFPGWEILSFMRTREGAKLRKPFSYSGNN